jgi:hypothetical protein
MEKREFADRMGQRFGQLAVIGLSSITKYGKPRWSCYCSCGKKTTFQEEGLVQEFWDRCNLCALKHYATFNIPVDFSSTTPHKALRNTCYGAWYNMVNKCLSYAKTNKRYYRDQGITICERWRKFENFYKDMTPQPTGFCLSRIDKERSYSKENCRWMTDEESMIGRNLSWTARYESNKQESLFEDDNFLVDAPPATPTKEASMKSKLELAREAAELELSTSRAASLEATEKANQAMKRLEKIGALEKDMKDLGL